MPGSSEPARDNTWYFRTTTATIKFMWMVMPKAVLIMKYPTINPAAVSSIILTAIIDLRKGLFYEKAYCYFVVYGDIRRVIG